MQRFQIDLQIKVAPSCFSKKFKIHLRQNLCIPGFLQWLFYMVYMLNVVYFDQGLGATDSKPWLKYTFSAFLHKKAEKEEKVKKFAPEHWSRVLFPEKSSFQWWKHVLSYKKVWKIVEKAYFNQHLGAAHSKHGSKYTTANTTQNICQGAVWLNQ